MTTLTRNRTLVGDDKVNPVTDYIKHNRTILQLAGVILIAQQAVFLLTFAIL